MRRALAALCCAALAAPAAASADGLGLVVHEDGTRSELRLPSGTDGVLTSDSTRVRGLITEDDVTRAEFRLVRADDPAATLRKLDERIDRNDRLRLPLTIVLAALLIGLALVQPRWSLRALLVVLAANLWLSPALALAAGLAAVLLPLGWACAAVLAVYLASLGLDAETVALSPFGPSQVHRFYGVNNLLETMLLAPALVGAAALGRRGIVVAALALVAIGGNRFGADGGGLVVLAVAYLVLALRLSGRALTWRLGAAAAAAAVVGALALAGLDAATGGSSHVTDALGDGPAALAGDLGRRVERSVERTADSAGSIAVVLGSVAILVAIALRARREPVLVAFLAGLATSLLVNDTPNDVLGAGAAIAIALALRPDGAESLGFGPMRRSVTLLAALALAAGVAGCGGGEEVSPTPQTVEGTLPAATTEEAPASTVEGDASNGEQVFASAGCGGCHTLEAAGTSGNVGPNLDEAKPDMQLVVTRVTNGAGAMPSFKDQLSEQEIADVAAYVVESTQG